MSSLEQHLDEHGEREDLLTREHGIPMGMDGGEEINESYTHYVVGRRKSHCGMCGKDDVATLKFGLEGEFIDNEYYELISIDCDGIELCKSCVSDLFKRLCI